MCSLSMDANVAAIPSSALSSTLPVKPSHTTTSTCPAKSSLASMFPTKLRSAPFSKRKASLLTWFPLPSSVPTLSKATFGLSRCNTLAAYSAPITPYCMRCSGLASTFAPASNSITPRPLRVGISGANAGRSIPSRRPTSKSPAAINAPVLPAVTTASTWPVRNRLAATTREDCFLRRTARLGLSRSEITSVASAISTRPANPVPASRGARTVSGPTSTTVKSFSRTASNAPATIAWGAWSPPSASTAIRKRNTSPFTLANHRPARGLTI